MMKSKKFFFISVLALLSCRDNSIKNSDLFTDSTASRKVISESTSDWFTPKGLTPFSFLELMRNKNSAADTLLGVIVMTDSFPDNWLKQADIDSLMKLVNSKEKCKCFLNPLSSYIPHDSADIGGYAIALVRSFKQKKKVSFGLYACPKTNEKDAEGLIKWWAQR